MINSTYPSPPHPSGGLVTWVAAGGLVSLLALSLPSTTYAQETAAARQDTARTAMADSSSDSTQWGYPVNRDPSEQNPQGYRGMERPAGLSDSAQPDSAAGAGADATNRVSQMERQDSIGNPDQNPPGYRGMERPVPSDTGMTSEKDSLANQNDNLGPQKDSLAAKKAAKKSGSKKKQASSTVRVGQDMGHQPPPYPADSEQAWVREQPSGDSVSVELQQFRDSTEQNNRQ